jgi:glucose-1-phosphate thymidylyltransferase
VTDSFIVLSGDNIIDQKSIETLITEKSKYSILIKEHPHPSKYGVIFKEKNILKDIIEKPKEELGKFISTGIYKLPYSVFNNITKLTSHGVYALTSVIQSAINSGEKINTTPANFWMDIVYPWDLIQVNEALIQNASSSVGGVIEKNVTTKGIISIGKDTTIYSGCYIVGPVIIGEGCEIGPNVCIFPSTSIGDNCVIQPFSEIRNSLIMEDIHIGSHSFITHSIIAKGTTIGNNLSSIIGKKTIEIEGEYKQLENIGVMIGEDTSIGSNVVIEPGTVIGRKCEISSLKRITQNIPSNSKVI